MTDEKEIKDRITKKAEEMYLRFGFSKVTMEELASELGMSKKTLYKYYPGKEQILKEIVSGMKCTVHDHTNEIAENPNLDFMTKLKMIMGFVSQNINKLRGPLLTELQKNHPEIYNELNEFRRKGILERFSKMAGEGIKAGYFRNDVDERIVVLIYMNVITGILNPDVLSELPFTGDQVFDSISKVIFEGVLTEEGKKKFYSTEPVLIIKDQELI